MCVFGGGGGSTRRAPTDAAPATTQPTATKKSTTPTTASLKTQRATEKERIGVGFSRFGLEAAQRTTANGAVVSRTKYVRSPAASGQLVTSGTGIVF